MPALEEINDGCKASSVPEETGVAEESDEEMPALMVVDEDRTVPFCCQPPHFEQDTMEQAREMMDQLVLATFGPIGPAQERVSVEDSKTHYPEDIQAYHPEETKTDEESPVLLVELHESGKTLNWKDAGNVRAWCLCLFSFLGPPAPHHRSL